MTAKRDSKGIFFIKKALLQVKRRGEMLAQGADASTFAGMMAAGDIDRAGLPRFVVAALGIFAADEGLCALACCLLQEILCRAAAPGDMG